ncbi:hypothetical protein [Yoonia sp.]|uniref:hypothetical protein n=1 Tax=Yoonia sp. TaxID=2212373 RepID=UPI0039754B2D
MNDPTVLSPYWENVDKSILRSQKSVFDKLGIPLKQVATDGESHGDWMNRVAKSSEDDIIVFVDIDAFPLSRDAYELAVKTARSGGIFGLAQVANHIDPSAIYAGPMFLAFSNETYLRLGQPSLCHSDTHDPAQLLSIRAIEIGVPLTLSYPRNVLIPKWPLSDIGIFGIGTFYGENNFFHLFQSRMASNIRLLNAVSEDVVSGRLDFARYLLMIQQPERSSLWKRLRGQK